MHRIHRIPYQFMPYNPPSPLPECSLDREELNQIAMDWGEFDLIIPEHSTTPTDPSHSNTSSISNNSITSSPKMTIIDMTKATKKRNSSIFSFEENDHYERRKRSFEERALNYTGFVSASQYLLDKKNLQLPNKVLRQFEE